MDQILYHNILQTSRLHEKSDYTCTLWTRVFLASRLASVIVSVYCM